MIILHTTSPDPDYDKNRGVREKSRTVALRVDEIRSCIRWEDGETTHVDCEYGIGYTVIETPEEICAMIQTAKRDSGKSWGWE